MRYLQSLVDNINEAMGLKLQLHAQSGMPGRRYVVTNEAGSTEYSNHLKCSEMKWWLLGVYTGHTFRVLQQDQDEKNWIESKQPDYRG